MNWLDAHLLTVVTFLPLATGLLLLLLRSLPEQTWKVAALGATTLTFLLSLRLWLGYDPTRTGYQFVEYATWLPSWGVHYFVGIDGMSLLLVVLTTFLMPLVLVAAWNDPKQQVKSFVFFNLFLETGMLGAFVALNLFQFYVFWEIMLVPMYFIIGIWGGPRRVYAAVKFFLFTMVGSLLMLVAILVLYSLHQQQFGVATFDLVRRAPGGVPALLDTAMPLAGQAVWWKTQPWLFAAFALAFGIKVPMVPFHTWLPDAHTEAPTAGSVILAGVLLKMGTYGFVRFALPLFPVAAEQAAPLIFGLALAGILYGALVAMVQTDLKKLVAYSSVAHLGFVMLGIFALNEEGLEGSILQMVNHGLSTGALFLLVGMIYERRHTRQIAAFGGIARPMPVFALLFGIAAMSSIGLPGLNGFVGEFLILAGTFLASPWVGATATFGVVLAAAYLLWAYRRVFFGPVEEPENRSLIDLSFREMLRGGRGADPDRLDRRLPEPVPAPPRRERRRPAAPDGAEEGGLSRSLPHRDLVALARGGGCDERAATRSRRDRADRLHRHRRAGRAARRGVALAAQDLPRPRRHRGLGRHGARAGRGARRSASRSTRPAATFASGASITFDLDNPMLRLDTFAAYATVLIGDRVVPGLLALDHVSRRAAHQPRRVLRADPALDGRHVPARRRRRPALALPRPRADEHPALRAGRLRSPQPAQQRVVVQVLPGRLVRERDPALRHRADLRRHRRARLRGHSQGLPAGQSARHDRPRAARRRLRLQGRGGAVPPVGARRLRGRAHLGHRVHGDHREGGGVRGAAAADHAGLRPRSRRVSAICSGCSPPRRSSSAT